MWPQLLPKKGGKATKCLKKGRGYIDFAILDIFVNAKGISSYVVIKMIHMEIAISPEW